jgi:ArsR family transcriptional regulator, arsenate/arsenite/antimonite-responsive transcriptional repressor
MVGTITLPAPATPVADRAALLKAVADPTRLAVLDTLTRRGARCHCELEEELAVPANRLSFHLKVLRDADLVGSTRCGKRVSYHLQPGAVDRLAAALPTPARGAAVTPPGQACARRDGEVMP